MRDRSPVVEIYNPVTLTVGSGFLLGDRLVLTARHVVVDDRGLAVRCSGRRLAADAAPEENPWIDLDLLHPISGMDDDITLAEFRRPPPLPPGGADEYGLGQVNRDDVDEPLDCWAVGFPAAASRPDGVREPHHLFGVIPVAGHSKTDKLAVTVVTATPSRNDGSHAGWRGLSGSALIVREHVVGVLTHVTSALEGRQLTAVPVTRLTLEPDARRLLVEAGLLGADEDLQDVSGPLCLQLEDRSVTLNEPHRRLPGDIDLRAHPSHLLDPKHAIVGFVPEDALAELEEWCEGPARLSVKCLLGGGGAGKSRLAAELCRRRSARGWDAGVADESSPEGRLRTRLRRSTLVVVDSAERKADVIQALLHRFALREHGPRLRLLLVARSKQVWWDQVNAGSENDDDVGLGDAYATDELWLDAMGSLTSEQRREHLLAAADAFSRRLALPAGSPGALVQMVDLAPDDFEKPELVHVVALLACLDPGGVPPAGESEIRVLLLRNLLAVERKRWRSLVKLQGFGLLSLPAVAADAAVTVTTLATPPTDELARRLVPAVPRLDPDLVTGLVEWLHVACPGGQDGLAPVRPAMLAEQLLAETPGLGALLVAVTERALAVQREHADEDDEDDDDVAGTVATILAGMLWEAERAASQRPVVREALGRLLDSKLGLLTRTAVDRPRSGLAPALVAALRCAPAGRAAAAALDLADGGGPYLRGLRLELAEQGIAHLEARGADPARLADGWRKLGVRRGQARRRGPAVSAAVCAVQHALELDTTHTDAVVLLARALDSLANRLGEAGHRRWAFEVSTRAVRLFVLARRRGELQQPSDLARALANLADHRAAVGRQGAALAAAVRAMRLYQGLDPGARDEVGFAEALNTASVRYAKMPGHRREALDAAENCVGAYEILVAKQADEYRPGLANALITLSLRRGDVGSHEQAAGAAGRAVELAGELVPLDPLTGTAILGRALAARAQELAQLGRADQALPAAQESVGLFDQLVSDVGETHLPGLAAALAVLGRVLHDRRAHAPALAQTARSVQIYENLLAGGDETGLDGHIRVTALLARCYRATDSVDDARRTERRLLELRRLSSTAALPDWCRPAVRTRRAWEMRRRRHRRRR